MNEEERKAKIAERKQELLTREEKQYEGLFRPQTNSYYFPDSKSVFDRMKDDVEKRSILSQSACSSKVIEKSNI